MAQGADATHLAWAALQRQFLARLPARAQRLHQATTADEALAEWHRLAGVAGSYGHAALGELARRALDACHAAQPGDADDAATARILAAALAELDAALRQLAVDTPSGQPAEPAT